MTWKFYYSRQMCNAELGMDPPPIPFRVTVPIQPTRVGLLHRLQRSCTRALGKCNGPVGSLFRPAAGVENLAACMQPVHDGGRLQFTHLITGAGHQPPGDGSTTTRTESTSQPHPKLGHEDLTSKESTTVLQIFQPQLLSSRRCAGEPCGAWSAECFSARDIHLGGCLWCPASSSEGA